MKRDTEYRMTNEALVRVRAASKIDQMIKDYLDELPEPEPLDEDITAVESPKALEGPTKKRSGEYLVSEVANAIKESKTG